MATWEEEQNKMTDTGLTVGDLFNATAPTGKTGQQLWEEQNAANNAPPAPSVASPPTAPSGSNIVQGVTTPVTGVSTPAQSVTGNNWVQAPTGQWTSSDTGAPAPTAAPWTPSPGATPGAQSYTPAAPTGSPAPAEARNAAGRTAAEQQAWERQVAADAAAVANRTADDLQKQRAVENDLAQKGLDLQKMIADANAEYQRQLVATGNAQLAEKAFVDRLNADYQTGQLNLGQQQQAAQTQYWGQQIALQQGQQRVALRQRRPFRSARIRMVA